MHLIIGNKNYSSWSLRGWFMLKAYNLSFTETRLPLLEDDFYTKIVDYSPAGKVPVLIDNGINVWDSLAICEYINETHLNNTAWPADPADRATARAIACEMHSGFFGVRNEMPMNCRAKRLIEFSADALKDIARIDQMWADLRASHADRGPWLFGDFSIADVMYAPVALRFHTYNPAISELSQQYVDTVLVHPAIQHWVKDAKQETEVVQEDEAGTPVT
ncbi:MAG: glutathione S-transferase family protein [Amphritea sp.]